MQGPRSYDAAESGAASHGPPVEGAGRGERIQRIREPTGREVTFGADELIVTKTDLTGRITYANLVFLRVADFTEVEAIGQPHSLIRHPDMPRCVFRLLWSTIQEGREIFAYVLNLARSGDHYWVFAHVSPTYDDHGTMIGYHSSRRCPDREQITKVKPVYARLLAEERRHPRKEDAMRASTELLGQIIADSGCRSYEEFVFSV